MMDTFYILYTLLLAVGSAVVGLRCLTTGMAQRRRNCEERLVRRTAHLLTVALLDGGCDTLQLPLDRVVGRQRLLAEVAAEVITSLYGVDPAPLGTVLARYGVEEWLLRSVRHSRGCRRARYLRLMADLPLSKRTQDAVERYRHDAAREVRFCALLVQLAATPSQVLRLIAAFEYPLTAVEVAEVLHLLRRGVLPIAYQPLLEAAAPNLRRIGLALVAQFGIEEAEPQLLQQLAAGCDEEWAERTIAVLAVMRRPLRRRLFQTCLAAMEPASRRRLLRLMAREEYTAEQIRMLFGEPDLPYYERLVGSYKRSLVCG